MNFKIKDKKSLITVILSTAIFVMVFLIIFLIIAGDGKNTEDVSSPPKAEVSLSENIPERGVWIATVYNIDFPSKPDLTADELRAELDDILSNAENAGLTSVFFQVRPAADALYKSGIFPVSDSLSSEGTLTLDCLKYLTEAAHKKEIKVHAWINPLRAGLSADMDSLSPDSPARKNPGYCVQYADSKLYFDCGLPEVRQLVCDGIAEIVRNYDVDGIIFDDYFYPYPQDGAEFDDANTYKRFGGDFDTIGDFRRESVNSLIKQAYETVKSIDTSCVFGVSPFGIWKNGTGNDDGSATSGLESYSQIYCDTVSWLDGGFVDYIAPQIYWNTESAAPYSNVCSWWGKICKKYDIPFIVCHGAYRYEEWESPEGVMTKQVREAKNSDSYRGSIFYGYEEIKCNTCGITDELKAMYK